MTCIVQRFKTKKELREHAARGGSFDIHDPSIFNERWFNSQALKEGEEVVVTNHPKRSWFAQVGRKGGRLYVK